MRERTSRPKADLEAAESFDGDRPSVEQEHDFGRDCESGGTQPCWLTYGYPEMGEWCSSCRRYVTETEARARCQQRTLHRDVVGTEPVLPGDPPICEQHGIPTSTTRETCARCVKLTRRARARGWLGYAACRTGSLCSFEIHCSVCAECGSVGTVCLRCHRCRVHAPDFRARTFTWEGVPRAQAGEDPAAFVNCLSTRWSRLHRQRVSFLDHTYFDAAAGVWRR